jgi:cellulose synthase/poly-beta-1,6-N-acetylglucosamine synthase-like glycosyltransferase
LNEESRASGALAYSFGATASLMPPAQVSVRSGPRPPLVGRAAAEPRAAGSGRRLVAYLLVAPLTVLLGFRLDGFLHDPLFSGYGAVVLGTTAVVLYLAFAHYRDPSLDLPIDAATPRVSCVVAVRNEELVIERCVESLFASDYPRVEVIVVDDGSTDATPVLLVELRARHPGLQVIRLPASVGKKRALTVGVERAAGEIFVFSDSDCVVAPDAVTRLVCAFAAHPGLGAVSGHARALNADQNILTKAQDTWYEGQFSVWKAAESVFGAVTCISGPLAAFRREAVMNFLPAWANDRFLGKEFPSATDRQLTSYVLGAPYVGDKLKRRHADSPFVLARDYPCQRWQTGYVKSARVRTVVPWTLRRLLSQQVRWKKSFIRNLVFVGLFQWRRGPVPSLLFYGRAVFILAAPLMAVRHLVWLPLHGAYLLSALYIVGILFKGCIWALAYRAENPGCPRWIYRPFMSLLTALVFSMLLPYSLLTLRRGVWARG